ncbi:sugar phosphate isomerase/epimerase family protein [Lysinibacter cavernae]|uniref:Sugar phosphate isomerase/epimerase n=1 Tax=Lysinibacter cavernae TaxID=1640652 RepID=A0A7X5TTH4_9MICO|nr:sugar phosphate isomerase/epimerase [Lysinibacter cavernae]NIH53514.1 sugar phosphate isomerase/epimerase [Lysinibacter cavernae]
MSFISPATNITLSSYTLGLTTEVPFRERVRAAAEAGFSGVGLRVENYVAAQAEGLSDSDMLATLDEYNIRVTEVEYLTGWGPELVSTDAEITKEANAFHMCQLFGVAQVNVGLLEQLDHASIVDALTALCDRAGSIIIAVEYMPYSGIPNIPEAWAIIEATGKANAHLLVDTWHWARAGQTSADLARVPADRIVSVQLCDVLEHAMTPLRVESLHHRLLPGLGWGDPVGMLRALEQHGATPNVVTVEVISDELAAKGIDEAARVAYTATRSVLNEASKQS